MHVPHKSSIILRALLPLVVVLFITGCSTNQQCNQHNNLQRVDSTPHANLVKQAQTDWSWISGTTWMVKTIEGQPPTQDTSIWIEFQDHAWMTASAGCNQISASYERRGIDGLKISNIAATKMHCPQPAGVMQQESRFLHLLGNIDSYHAEPGTLTLSTNGITMLTFEPIYISDF